MSWLSVPDNAKRCIGCQSVERTRGSTLSFIMPHSLSMWTRVTSSARAAQRRAHRLPLTHSPAHLLSIGRSLQTKQASERCYIPVIHSFHNLRALDHTVRASVALALSHIQTHTTTAACPGERSMSSRAHLEQRRRAQQSSRRRRRGTRSASRTKTTSSTSSRSPCRLHSTTSCDPRAVRVGTGATA